MGVFEQAGTEAFLLDRGVISGDAGDQAQRRFEHRHGRHFAAGKDKVAERNFEHAALVDDALVKAFEAAAEEGEAGAGRPILGEGLGERHAARARIDERGV